MRPQTFPSSPAGEQPPSVLHPEDSWADIADPITPGSSEKRVEPETGPLTELPSLALGIEIPTKTAALDSRPPTIQEAPRLRVITSRVSADDAIAQKDLGRHVNALKPAFDRGLKPANDATRDALEKLRRTIATM